MAITGKRADAMRRRHRAWCEQVEELLWANRGVIRVGEHSVTRRAVRVALANGIAVRHGRGVIATRDAAPERIAAVKFRGVVSHLSAAKLHGWKLARDPDRVHVTVPRGRRLTRAGRPLPTVAHRSLTAHYATLTWAEKTAGITTPIRTVLDCATSLPFAEALAVADSALRAGDVTSRGLVDAADRLRGRGAAKARRVVAHATGLAANPYESTLRAICLQVPGLRVVPQTVITTPRLTARVDLADSELRLVLEADSYTFHATPDAFAKDVRRYNELTLNRWTVLRFTWHHVFNDPGWVVQVLTEAVTTARARGSRRLRPPAAAISG